MAEKEKNKKDRPRCKQYMNLSGFLYVEKCGRILIYCD